MKIKFFGLTLAAAATVAILFGRNLTNAQQDAPPPSDAQTSDSQPDSEPADALPPDVAANAALVEVINLSQGGVSEDVIQNYINNVQTPFNLSANDLIYLKDIGIPDSDVIAMQQRDQQLGQAAPQPAQTAAPAPPTTVVSDDGFYDSLAPYGNWVVISGYGRCWRPAVVVYDSSWQPYCDHGHWVWTDDGWYWYSDYSWGWATFHYGRWFRDAHYGWCWYPDTVWGPSWVCWRYSDDYCGWAPLPPHCEYREGVGLVFNGSHVSVGFDFGLSVGAFTFVATRDFCDSHPWRHRIDRERVTQIYNHTTVINNITINNGNGNRTIINNGIPRNHIEAVTHTPIRQVTIRDSHSPVRRGERFENGNTLVVNRPHIERTALHSENQPRTIPSPTTGQPMRVPAPNENRNNLRQRNQTSPQNINHSPNGAPVRPAINNRNRNENQNTENRNSYPAVTQPPQNENRRQNNSPQNNIDHFGSTLPSTQTQQQNRNYPPVQPRTERRTPTYTPPANQPEQNRAANNPRRDYRSPRMSQQPTPQTHYVAPPAERAAPRTYSEPYHSQPSPRVEMPQSSPRVYQAPQPQVQQPAPQQNYQPQRQGRDKNDH